MLTARPGVRQKARNRGSGRRAVQAGVGGKGSYRSLSAFLAEYNEGLGRRHRKTSPESTLRRGILISLLNKDISKFKEADQKKMKEYIETDGNLQNLYSAVNRFREILKGKDESRLEDWLSEVKRYNIRELDTFIMSVERETLKR